MRTIIATGVPTVRPNIHYVPYVAQTLAVPYTVTCVVSEMSVSNYGMQNAILYDIYVKVTISALLCQRNAKHVVETYYFFNLSRKLWLFSLLTSRLFWGLTNVFFKRCVVGYYSKTP